MDGTAITSSARGWHGLQLAALAFIGFCGVLSDADPTQPRWLQVGAGIAALAALVLASVAIVLVARVAWPLPGDQLPAEADRLDRAGRRLRVGIALTFLAVALMALAATSSWWPARSAAPPAGTAEPASVVVTDATGATACGRLLDGPTGALRLATAQRTVDVALDAIADIAPVDTC